ncbi:treslin isoform X2 [Oryzias melastigma]|uniref:treslin isoform X2 n=1 Tax=Oryzias melastigma TaxID=30732 RepID=UPI000CF7C61B|nr:treslin isoform X2 [Oryzias melastigma]
MASHNIVFLIDVDLEDHESDRQVNVKIDFIKRGILQVLLHFGYKLGLEKLRWGYKFFQSKTRRPSNTLSRASDFKELRQKTFEDFEQEFETRFDLRDKLCSSRQKQQPCQLVQNAVRETLLDFQWDRPDITSPTKPSLRPRKSGRAGKPSLPHEDDVSNSGKNVVFVVSQCPTSRAQFLDYLSCKDDELSSNPAEFIISKNLKDMLLQQQVLLHWIDTRSYNQVVRSEDHLGSDEVSAVLAQVAGRVIPLVALLDLCCQQKSDSRLVKDGFGLKSSIGYLLSSESLFQQARPSTRGVLRWDRGNTVQSCGVTVEPVLCRQRIPQEPVDVCVKGVVPYCDASSFTQISTESWVLKEHCSEEQEAAALQHLLRELSSLGSNMLAEVNVSGLECSAVLSPLSHSTALLTVLQPEIPQHHQLLKTPAGAAQTSTELPAVVSSVLGVVYDIMNKEEETVNDKMQDQPVPEWAQQEFSHPVTTSLLEAWFPHSDMSGVSSHLMESFRLLSAVPEQSEEEELQQELIGGLSELYQASVDHVNKRGRKRGAHCTPVKQRMKTMSRSLQMLNVARLNVKALKNQAEEEQTTTESRTADKPGKRRMSTRGRSAGQSSVTFTSEAELLTHLKASYDRGVAEKDSSVLEVLQQLVTAVKAFLGAKSNCQGQVSVFVQKHLLKTSKSIRQLYGAGADTDSKVRECQLQVMLRLELCSLLASEPSDSLDADTMTEEAAEMLRIISLTKDPVFLSRFLLDEVIPGFLNSVPRDLANIYHNLGTQLPEVLVAVLPADFFSDESINKDSISPSVSSSATSASNLVSNGNAGLQDLRSRTANRKRSGMLTRHRSTTESSQSFRQVEIPKKALKAPKTGSVASDKPAVDLQPQKQEAKEVTKVRRNLFNQEVVPQPKKSKLSRSQSVSAVEGLKRKRPDETEERHKLLTKKVCDTPVHKQVSSRLLHRQKIGRRSDFSEDFIVEESPVKPAEELRRSPRIQKFSRRHSNTFYSCSQSRSRNLDRALSSSQLFLTDVKACEVNVKTVKSPLRLLFGAAESPGHDQPAGTKTSRTRLPTDSSVFESPNKTPTKSPRCGAAVIDGYVLGTPCTPKTPESKPSTRTQTSSGAESPAEGSSGLAMTLRSSPFRSPAKTPLDLEMLSKQSPMKSPLKGILKTPVKTNTDHPSGMGLRSHQAFRTPKKSVTWSPSPQKLKKVENVSSFKVPESPKTASHSCSGILKTPSKLSSPVLSLTRAIFTTPTKICQVKLVRMPDRAVLTPEKTSTLSTKLDRTKTPEKDEHFSPPEMSKTASPGQQRMTRSGQTLSPSQKDSASSEGSPSSLTCTSKGLKKIECKRKPTHSSKLQPVENLVLENINLSSQEETSYSSSFHTDSQEDGSSQGNSATTDSDSLDIVDAAVVKSQFSGGLKMNISFSRKSSASGGKLESPKHVGTASRGYGFRQTPDRQQREAAARLGYSNEFPRFSTPRGSKRLAQPKESPLTYQVELEMQTSGLPKLKIKRTDFPSDRSPPVGASKPYFESPLALLPKHKDAGCVSPSLCAHATPAKSTPLKGVGVQTFICQSYTPTRLPAAAASPKAVADVIPLTPSPQCVGRVPPDNLNSWPRRKRPNIETKERQLKADPQLDELLEEAELGVGRLQDMEDTDEPPDSNAEETAFNSKPMVPCGAALSPKEDLYWTEKLTEQNNPQGTDSDVFWFHENGDFTPTVETPPSSKKIKPVTASGILALTQSPLLFKSRAASTHLRRSNSKQEDAEADGVDFSGSSPPVRHSRAGKTYSRKRLIH